jgi:hypothetical protein
MQAKNVAAHHHPDPANNIPKTGGNASSTTALESDVEAK